MYSWNEHNYPMTCSRFDKGDLSSWNRKHELNNDDNMLLKVQVRDLRGCVRKDGSSFVLSPNAALLEKGVSTECCVIAFYTPTKENPLHYHMEDTHSLVEYFSMRNLNEDQEETSIWILLNEYAPSPTQLDKNLRLVEVETSKLDVGSMNGVVNHVGKNDECGILYGWRLLSAF